MKHEPCAPHEKFVGNQKGKEVRDELKRVEGIRVGAVAYDIHGNRLGDETGLFPLFIGRGAGEDTYDQIMMRRTTRRA